MAQAKTGDKVKVNYTGKLKDGTVFDTSKDRQPLEFSIGSGELIPDFEQAVIGMNTGETKTIEIPVDRAYGPYNEKLVIDLDKSKMPPELDPKVGQHLEVAQGEGKPPIIVLVKEVTDKKVVVDANHPLAGKDLIFDIELLEII